MPVFRKLLAIALWVYTAIGVVCNVQGVMAQVVVEQPKQNALIQLAGDSAAIHVAVALPPDATDLIVQFWRGETPVMVRDWTSLPIHNNRVDTVVFVERSTEPYLLNWHASSGIGYGGEVRGLRVGHIIGIAGQSNAQGYCWQMMDSREGDIWMLDGSDAWVPAMEPTGGVAGGPWIVMANRLWAGLHDSLPIGIINCAVGGTGIVTDGPDGKWIRNPDDPMDTSTYGRAIRRFRSVGGLLEALCWIQGEADGADLKSPDLYRWTFQGLMQHMQADVGYTFPIFHSQISGNSRPGFGAMNLPEVREAQRRLPMSTLVGTAVGRPIQSDGLHYTAETLRAIGRTFADAIITERYHKRTSQYPPLVPDTVAYFDSIVDGSIPGKYCIALQWMRGGEAAELETANPDQFFTIWRDGAWLDTSKVWFRISPFKPGVVQVGLRDEPITFEHTWKLGYIRTAGADHAPLITRDPGSGDTTFAIAFEDLRVVTAATPPLRVEDFYLREVHPNPSGGTCELNLLCASEQRLTISILDARGTILQRFVTEVQTGENDIRLPIEVLSPGVYWARAEGRNATVTKKFVTFGRGVGIQK